MKVLLLSRYGPLGASSRVRFLQYLPYFSSQGIDMAVKPLFSDAYVQALYSGNSKWKEVVKGYFYRLFLLFTARKYDLVIIEKELFPFMPALAERFLRIIRVPYLVDYDDAIFHNYDRHKNPVVRRLLGKKIDTVMRLSSAVTVGNSYLAERANKAGAIKAEIIPTVIDAERYQCQREATPEVITVGWIGTPQTSRYLKPLLPVFESLQKKYSVRFVAIGANANDFVGTPVEAWPWTEITEVSSIQQLDIGIMPLTDSPWERGKCGYKLIQYMACAIPVVASPVGVNCEIVREGENGMLAGSIDEWSSALDAMLKAGPERLEEMGRVGRKSVDDWYSLNRQKSRFLEVMRESLKGSLS
ncbi:glycosyltransferase family 4 protein [Pseudomonas sp. C27(2019)]|uniref:glycosyltransferase family 4 protein n=1 Tax=Pseudomonas sp. C27(2019) TaxID=2604941 RepID=UPI001247FA79|nr:glycosyltransferase family 4 protein [Pseudomonas sp. C27(2019)]QEY59397.1 glycosyltransferase family 4 protein [Pseudomonas sp. C27(2019)]